MKSTQCIVSVLSLCIAAGVCLADDTGEQVVDDAISLGLTPPALAAAGFDGRSTQALLSRVEAAETLRQDLSGDQVRFATAASHLAAAKANLQAHPGNARAVSDVDSARDTLRTAHAQLAAARGLLRDAAMDGLAGDRETTLRLAIVQQTHQSAVELCVVGRSERDWSDLNRDLRTFARLDRLGAAIPADLNRRVTGAFGDTRVVASRLNIEQNSAAIEQVFHAVRNR